MVTSPPPRPSLSLVLEPIRAQDGRFEGRLRTQTTDAWRLFSGVSASVIYQCLNAPYTKWAEHFPPLQRGVLAAAERNRAHRRYELMITPANHTTRAAPTAGGSG